MIAAVMMWIIGIIFIVLGYMMWKKQKVSFLHSYHYDKVPECEKQVFCTISGIGIILIGVGILITGILVGITDSSWSFLAFVIGFAAGMGMLIYAGTKCNRK